MQNHNRECWVIAFNSNKSFLRKWEKIVISYVVIESRLPVASLKALCCLMYCDWSDFLLSLGIRSIFPLQTLFVMNSRPTEENTLMFDQLPQQLKISHCCFRNWNLLKFKKIVIMPSDAVSSYFFFVLIGSIMKNSGFLPEGHFRMAE